MTADGAPGAEEVGGEAPVDNRDLGVLLHVRPREVAPLENRDPHRLEIVRRQRVHERLHVFAVCRFVSLDGGAIVPFAAAQDRNCRHRRGRHASRSAQSIEQFLVQLCASRIVVAVQLRRDLKGHEVVERDAGVRRLQILQAADEQARAEEQQEAERDLHRHETFAQEQRSAAAGNRSHRVLERRPRIGTAGADRGNQAEDDAGRCRHHQREREDPQVGTRADRERLAAIWHQREQRARQGDRERDAGDTAECRQDAAFDEHLADQTPT